MKDLVKTYLDSGLSRRNLIAGLIASGLGASAADAIARSIDTRDDAADDRGALPNEVTGTGGALFVQQLRAAGIRHIFFNCATRDAPIYDACVDLPDMALIKAVHEGSVVAMADGYARVSGEAALVIVAASGLPNAMTQMINSWKDQIPLVVVTALDDQQLAGRESWQEFEHEESMMRPLTKWHWTVQNARDIPEMLRRALKFASTPPCGPVFLGISSDSLAAEATATIMDQRKFQVPMAIRPTEQDITQVALALINARSPILSVGDEVSWCRGEKELVELAELLGIPVAGQAAELGYWSKPFPTRHPLYIGHLLPQMRFPQSIDLHLNIGSRYGEIALAGAKLISIRFDPSGLARSTPVDLGLVADVRLATIDLIAQIRKLKSTSELEAIASKRISETRQYTEGLSKLRLTGAQEAAKSKGKIKLAALALELERGLPRDTIYVPDVDSGKTMNSLMSFGGEDKRYVATGPNIYGWAMGAAFGAKLAQPDKPVVAILGDGAFLFSGPQPLWSFTRYKAPVIVIVLNNNSYNNERNRIWNATGAQFSAGRDMTCYLGDPDVNYVKLAEGFGVDAERVGTLDAFASALKRAQAAVSRGRPFLLDVIIEREGIGAASIFHPPYSLAELRVRRV